MTTPLISIIIPCYNVEKFIEASASSVLNQTYSNIEALFILDCPTDNTEATLNTTLQNHKHGSKARVVHHEENKGQAVARDTGFKEAKGEFVFFFDSDDLLLPDALDKLHKISLKHPNVDCYTGSYASFWEQDFASVWASLEKENQEISLEKIQCFLNKPNEESGIPLLLSQGLIEPGTVIELASQKAMDAYPLITHPPLWNILIRRRVLDSMTLPLFVEGIWYEDVLFSTRLSMHAKNVVVLDEITLLYHLRASSTMRSYMKDPKKHIRSMEITMQKLETYYQNESNPFLKSMLLRHIILKRNVLMFMPLPPLAFARHAKSLHQALQGVGAYSEEKKSNVASLFHLLSSQHYYVFVAVFFPYHALLSIAPLRGLAKKVWLLFKKKLYRSNATKENQR